VGQRTDIAVRSHHTRRDDIPVSPLHPLVPSSANPEPDADHETTVLALNSGSSSLKFGLYRVQGAAVACLLSGEAEAMGGKSARIHASDAQGRQLLDKGTPMLDHGDAVGAIADLLARGSGPGPQAVGHRVVHGGPSLRKHCRIDPAMLQRLEAATPFAPLHTPAALAVIRHAMERFPGVPQAACFDTTFHANMPDVARVLALPHALLTEGIQRYGFHGLSCESIVYQLAGALPPRLLIAHLGNGASITAVLNGQSIDTSMGLTPTGGLIMGTRSGDLDPGTLAYLMREKQLDAAGVEDLVDHRSGLLGISGLASDMRALHAVSASNADADLAVRMFCYAAAKALAGMTVALGGVDLIVFTGGIGENDAQVRAAICSRLGGIGVALDDARNNDPHRQLGVPISRDASRCAVRVLPSQEDEQIARHAWALLEA
jgi:acetate kinase